MKKLLFAACLALSLTAGANEQSAPVRIRIYPAVTRDDGKSFIFSDRMFQIGFHLFTGESGTPVNLQKAQLMVEVPESVEIRSACAITGWEEGSMEENPVKISSEKPGRSRYLLPLPSRVTSKLSDKVLSFTGFFTTAYIVPGKDVPQAFDLNWELRHDGKVISGTAPFECIRFEPPKRLPAKFRIWAAGGTRFADRNAVLDQIEFYRKLGITDVAADRNRYVPDYFRLWKDAGFTLYGNYGRNIFNFDRTEVKGKADSPLFHVNIGGIHMANKAMYRNSPYCPSAYYDETSPVFQKIMQHIRTQAAQGVTSFFSDHEVDLYSFCYCERCRRDFAEYAGLDSEKILKMKPEQIAMKYPVPWYRFRCRQSGKFVEAIRKSAEKEGLKGLKFGLNGAICYHNYLCGNLGYGRALFADDPRLYDDLVDFHSYDSLYGGILDSVMLDTVIHTLKKPVFPRTMSSYCYGWAPGHCFHRVEAARRTGIPSGYDRAAEMQKMSILNLAATGCAGVELLTAGYDGNALMLNAIARAVETVALFEEIWSKGKRVEQEQKVFFPARESAYLKDTRTIAGKIWGYHFKANGPLMYRIHQLGNSWTFALFNWDMAEKQTVLWIPQNLPADGKFYLYDQAESVLYLPPDPNSETWTKEELAKGIVVNAESLKVSILTLSAEAPAALKGYKRTAAERPAPDAMLKEYNLYHYRLNRETDDYGLPAAVRATIREMKRRGFIPADTQEEPVPDQDQNETADRKYTKTNEKE